MRVENNAEIWRAWLRATESLEGPVEVWISGTNLVDWQNTIEFLARQKHHASVEYGDKYVNIDGTFSLDWFSAKDPLYRIAVLIDPNWLFCPFSSIERIAFALDPRNDFRFVGELWLLIDFAVGLAQATGRTVTVSPRGAPPIFSIERSSEIRVHAAH